MKKFALISVSNKEKIVELAQKLNEYQYTILATGNTAKLLLEKNVDCVKIEDFTSFPEIFDGRVKTLQPKIFGGILMRRDEEEDKKQAEENNIFPIDIVCVNLYPFPEVVKNKELSLEVKIENIDIGGPSLIRAASKNYKYVSVLTNPNQYDNFINELETGEILLSTRENLASDAFSHTAFYDTLIANYFEEEITKTKKALRINLPIVTDLRYGENPHQKATLYGSFNDNYEILHGKEVSFNNIIDLSAAVDLVMEINETACVIVKHTNPCGAAIGNDLIEAYDKALSCDPVSAFGGIVAFNKNVNLDLAKKLNDIFLEIIVAPSYDEDAIDELKKKKNRRLLKVNNYKLEEINIKSVNSGILIQESDSSKIDELELNIVTNKKCNELEIENLKFAWIVSKHTKSNAIVFVKDKKAIGVGAGQMSRVDSARIAAQKAIEHGHDLNGAVAASDAFFPFADGVEEIIKKGITAIIQPGGSVRDSEVIECANNNNVSMIFTSTRNFKH